MEGPRDAWHSRAVQTCESPPRNTAAFRDHFGYRAAGAERQHYAGLSAKELFDDMLARYPGHFVIGRDLDLY